MRDLTGYCLAILFMGLLIHQENEHRATYLMYTRAEVQLQAEIENLRYQVVSCRQLVGQ